MSIATETKIKELEETVASLKARVEILEEMIIAITPPEKRKPGRPKND